MSFAKTLMAAAAIATVSAQPVLAAEAAQKLSLKNAVSARTNTTAGKNKALAGVPLVLLILGGGLVIYGITEIVDDNDDSDSN